MVKFTFYNSLTKRLDELDIDKSEKLNWYICGPTVYDQAHLGHARTYLSFDIFQRIMAHYKIDLKTQMNITDVDDKIIRRSQELGIDPMDLTEKETRAFFNHLRRLSCLEVDTVTEVSRFIKEILGLIYVLIQGGYAYESNGSVYFSIPKYLEKKLPFPLRPESINDDQLQQGEFLSEKRDPRDFALWKAKKEGEPDSLTWESDYGPGRPGWHTECVAMILSNFDNDKGRIDCHFGGYDLLFPHHQNEIIQALAYFESSGLLSEEMMKDYETLGKFWSKYFIHIGQLNDEEGKKMSKSVGNFIAVDDWKKDPEILRMLVIKHHYRSSVNWTEGLVKDLEQSHQFLYESMDHYYEWYNLAQRSQIGDQKETDETKNDNLEQLQNEWFKFKEELDQNLRNDFHIEKVWESYQNFTNSYNNLVIKLDLESPSTLKLLREIYGMSLGFWDEMGFKNLFNHSPLTSKRLYKDSSASLVDLMINFRSKVRELAIKSKDREILKACDQLRDVGLSDLGFKVKDINKSHSVWSLK